MPTVTEVGQSGPPTRMATLARLMPRSRSSRLITFTKVREIWGDMGRYGELWGAMGRYHHLHEGRVDPYELAHGDGATHVLADKLLLQRAREKLDREGHDHRVRCRHPEVEPDLLGFKVLLGRPRTLRLGKG